MPETRIETIDILGVKVGKLTYKKFLEIIKEKIVKNQKLTVAYANADTLNKTYNNVRLKDIFNSFDLIHPDGTGIYFASKFLYGSNGLEKRIAGSDFYPLLIDESVKNNWRIFFFGHSDKTLNKINKLHPDLNIAGLQEGYKFDSPKVVNYINESCSDIVIVGLSSPIQEKWIFENKHKMDYKIILMVGDGIKVFAGEKIRGPVFLQNLGLEWLVRYLTSPVDNFSKYIIGVPLFGFRILKEKLKSY